ncbi:MAG: hypothetical protein FJ109_05635 [Deltaproteobacteria bacterium]|nr:hypothetical protein [Deltaproteobacteria bacterium]
MRNALVIGIVALAFGAWMGCDSSDNSKDVKTVDDSKVAAEVEITAVPDGTGDTGLPICPDEVILTGLLPCDCYGTVATDPDAQVPGCKTQVVCCPAIQGLRCEDHELLKEVFEEVEADVTPDVAPPADLVVPDGAVQDTAQEVVDYPTCPFEVALDNYTPCMCKGTLVEHVHKAMPDCDKKVVCCPYSGVKCE